MLLFDSDPDARPAPAVPWTPEPERTGAQLTIDALGDRSLESLRAVRSVARLAATPRGSGGRIGDTLRRTALAVGEDVLRAAPSSFLNEPIGPERILRRGLLPRPQVDRVRRHTGATVNDICLAAVAGALRELALARGENPAALKAMVPVSVRSEDERQDLGNLISFAFVDLPVHSHSALRRLESVQEQTRAFKRSGRPAGTQALLSALGVLPIALRKRAAQAMASQRAYNLVVSNIPGPPDPVYMLGAELREAYPVVPLSDRHALSIGIFSYRDGLFFGIYAEPQVLPDAAGLPVALSVSFRALERAVSQGPVRSRGPAKRSTSRPGAGTPATAGPDRTGARSRAPR
jgi:WS/DGAT/MGAT family acyltransferase